MGSESKCVYSMRYIVIVGYLVAFCQAAINPGSDFVLVCPLEGDYNLPDWFGPPGNVKLTDGNGNFPSNPEMSYNNSRDLKITNVKLNHTGEYTCKTSDGRTGSLNLTVTDAPLVFANTGVTWFSMSKTSLQFSCTSYRSGAEAIIKWSVDDAVNKTFKHTVHPTICNMDERQRFNCDSKLSVENLTKEDNGVKVSYNVEYENEIVHTHAWDPLTFYFPPTSIQMTGNEVVKLDILGQGTLNLTCSTNNARGAADGSGVLFYWYRDNKLIDKTDFDRVVTKDMAVGLDEGYNASESVTLAVNRDMHDAVIECLVPRSIALRDLKTEITLDIEYSPKLLEPVLSVYRAYVGDAVVIPCSADSNPPSNFSWTNVPALNVVGIADTNLLDNRGDLTLTNISMDDAGDYQCEAANKIEPKSSRTVTFAVYNAPVAPTQNGVHEATTSSLKVYMILPKPTPEIPLTYFVQFRKQMTPARAWSELSTPASVEADNSGFDVVIQDLLPSTIYEVRAKSVDAYGLASFSVASEYTTLKEKPKEEKVTETDRTNAILIAVFVTAAVFIVILVIVVWAIRKGKCGGSGSNKRMDLPM